MTYPESVTDVAVEQYEALGRGLREGDEPGYALLHFIDAWAHIIQDVSDLVSDSDDGPGWSLLFDVDRAPYAWLPILGVFAGVLIPPGLPDADARARIRSAPGRRRGTVGALRQAVTESLTGTQTVTLVERDGSPYVVTVQTYAAETPDADLTEAKALLQTPAWLVLNFGVPDGWSWQHLKDSGRSWQDVSNDFTDWDDVRTQVPV